MAKLPKMFLFLVFVITYHLPLTTYHLYAQDKIVAIVNNDIITQKDLNDFINFMRVQLGAEYKGKELENKIQSIKLDLLERLIEDRIILREAKLNNIKIDENRVKARLDEIKKRYASDADFQDSLNQQGLTQADIELKIREQLLMYGIIDANVRSKIVVNPAEVTDFYEKNMEELKTLQERYVTTINISDKNLVGVIYKSIKEAGDLNNVANKYSLVIDKMVVTENGQLRKDIEEVIFKLNIGEISSPIKINDTFYIFRLDNIIPPRKQNLSEVQDKIYAFLFEKKMQEALAKWLDEIKKQSYIKILQD